MKSEVLKALQGKRLKECLERCHLTQAEFSRKAKYSPTSLNEIVKANGKRGVPDYLIAEWSEILGIDVGYFVSSEKIKSYDDYKGRKFAKDEWLKEADFLKYCNCKIINMQMVDNKEIVGYLIHSKDTGENIDITADEMRRLKMQISEYAKFIIQNLISEKKSICTRKGGDADD